MRFMKRTTKNSKQRTNFISIFSFNPSMKRSHFLTSSENVSLKWALFLSSCARTVNGRLNMLLWHFFCNNYFSHIQPVVFLWLNILLSWIYCQLYTFTTHVICCYFGFVVCFETESDNADSSWWKFQSKSQSVNFFRKDWKISPVYMSVTTTNKHVVRKRYGDALFFNVGLIIFSFWQKHCAFYYMVNWIRA